jgi:Zn-dependent M28 family amino/carboxypeptidase
MIRLLWYSASAASGSSSVLEVFRVLASNGFRGDRSIEFHAYAAEEVGLLGSQAIASTYQKEGKVVAGMMQLGTLSLGPSPPPPTRSRTT